MRAAAYARVDGLDELAAGWLASVRAAVTPRPHLELVPERCALLVVDMLRYFAAPDGRCYLPATEATTPRIARLVSCWRRRGGTVVFTRHGHSGTGDLGMLGKFFRDYIRRGEPESEIIPALAPAPDEPVVDKTTYDAFLYTRLEPLLRSRRVSQVLITGVLTHMCCATTARSAFCRGFEVYLPVDAVASSTVALHLGALHGLADSVAVMMSTQEVVAACGR